MDLDLYWGWSCYNKSKGLCTKCSHQQILHSWHQYIWMASSGKGFQFGTWEVLIIGVSVCANTDVVFNTSYYSNSTTAWWLLAQNVTSCLNLKNNSTSMNCYSSRVKEFIRFKIQIIYRVYNIIAIKILLLHLVGQYYSNWNKHEKGIVHTRKWISHNSRWIPTLYCFTSFLLSSCGKISACVLSHWL